MKENRKKKQWVGSVLHLIRLKGSLCGLNRLIEDRLGHQLVLEVRLLTHPAELKLEFLVFCVVVDLVDAARRGRKEKIRKRKRKKKKKKKKKKEEKKKKKEKKRKEKIVNASEEITHIFATSFAASREVISVSFSFSISVLAASFPLPIAQPKKPCFSF